MITQQLPFFSNKDCPHFPCHEGIDPDSFNCIFCFCPLYALGEKCGGNYRYLEGGVKDCAQCPLPHHKNNGNAMVNMRFMDLAMLARPKGQ